MMAKKRTQREVVDAYRQHAADAEHSREERTKARILRRQKLDRFNAVWSALESAVSKWSEKPTDKNRTLVTRSICNLANEAAVSDWDWCIHQAHDEVRSRFETDPIGESSNRIYVAETYLLLELIQQSLDGKSQRTLSALLRDISPTAELIRAVDHVRFEVEAARVQVAPAESPRRPEAPTRPAYARDHKWLTWNQTDGLKPARIRDKWNVLSEEKRREVCPAHFDEVNIENVRTGLKTAKRELRQ